MTLAIILFLLAVTVIMLLTIPLAMMVAPKEWPELWVNIKFWAVVITACAVISFAVSYT